MVCPIHAYSGAQDRGKYCSNPFATRLEKKADGQQHAPAASTPLPRERHGAHCIGFWVCIGVDLEGTENHARAGIRNLGSPAHSDSLHLLRH